MVMEFQREGVNGRSTCPAQQKRRVDLRNSRDSILIMADINNTHNHLIPSLFQTWTFP
jgi:hypothetical protein